MATLACCRCTASLGLPLTPGYLLTSYIFRRFGGMSTDAAWAWSFGIYLSVAWISLTTTQVVTDIVIAVVVGVGSGTERAFISFNSSLILGLLLPQPLFLKRFVRD